MPHKPKATMLTFDQIRGENSLLPVQDGPCKQPSCRDMVGKRVNLVNASKRKYIIWTVERRLWSFQVIRKMLYSFD